MPNRRLSLDIIDLAIRLVAEGTVTVSYLDRNGIISKSTFYRHRIRGLEVKRKSTGRPRLLPYSVAEFLYELVLRRPALYLDELRSILRRINGRSISLSTVHRYLLRGGITLKRAHRIAQERSARKRAAYEIKIGQYEPSQLVFSDETSYDARDSVRVRARSKRNRNAVFPRSYTRGKRLSFDGCFASRAVQGSFNEHLFYTYLKNDLLPYMTPFSGPRSVLVLNNASIHHSHRIRILVEDIFNCKLEFLPSYSPDFNPIERAFAKIKASLCRRNAAVVDLNHFFEAVRDITLKDCEGWMRLAGYVCG
ncbi:unnamed protein product [Tilletia controversa]|nr:unnamed protein product [Tilletia controversa]